MAKMFASGDRREGLFGCHPDPRRLRLHQRLPGRAHLPRRARLADLRGCQRHPAAGHRPRHRGRVSMAAILRPEATPDDFERRAEGFLPGWFGMKVTAITPGRLEMELPIRKECWRRTVSCMPSVVALADTAAGFATIAHLPEGSESFTTIRLKTNFFSTQREGVLLRCYGHPCRTQHAGLGCQGFSARASVAWRCSAARR